MLEAAARILEERGLEAYTTNAVAKLAGVGIGSLYQYFSNKDAITGALIAREADRLIVELEHITATARGAEALDRVIAAAVHHQLGRPTLAKLLDVEEQRLRPGPDGGRLRDRVTAVIGRCLEGTPQAGEAQRDPLIVGDLLAVMRGLVDAAGARGERDEATLTRRVHRAVQGYLNG